MTWNVDIRCSVGSNINALLDQQRALWDVKLGSSYTSAVLTTPEVGDGADK